MAKFRVEMVDGRVFEVEAPAGTPQETLFAAIQERNPYAFKPTAELEAAPAAPFKAADIGRAAKAGVAGGLQSLTDIFGAGNVASQYLEEAQKAAYQGMSPERLEELQRREEIKKRAEGKGLGKEISSYLGGFTEAPIQTAVQALAGSAPIIASSLLPGGQATGIARLAAAARGPTAVGAAMGLGGQKGQDYETVKRALLEQGVPEAEAEQRAQGVAEYSMQNILRQAGAAAAGAAEGRFGVEPAVGRLLSRRTLEGVKTPPTWSQAIGQSVLGEAAPEALQAAVGTIGTNQALNQAGIPTEISQGLAGTVAHDALVGAVLGLGLSPAQKANLARDYESDKRKELEKRQAEEKAKIDEIARKQQEEYEKKGYQEIQKALAPQDLTKNPLGSFGKDELEPEVVAYIDNYRNQMGLPKIDQYSVEDIADAMPGLDKDREKQALGEIVGKKAGYTPDVNINVQNVLDTALAKNIDIEGRGFTDFLARTTGTSDLKDMTQPQLFAALKSLSALPESPTLREMEAGTNAVRFDETQYTTALNAVDNLLGQLKRPASIDAVRDEIKFASGLKSDKAAAALLDSAIQRGDLDEVQTPRYEAVNPATGEIYGRRYSTLEEAQKAAPEGSEVRKVTDREIAPPSATAVLPKGYEIKEGLLQTGEAPQAFDIKAGDQILSRVKSEEEAQAKLASYEKARASEARNAQKVIDAQNKRVATSQDNLNKMEAAGQGRTSAYQQAVSKHAKLVDEVNKAIARQTDRIRKFDPNITPLSIAPVGTKAVGRTGFTVLKEGVPAATYPTREKAERAVLGELTTERLEELARDTTRRGVGKKAAEEIERRAGKAEPEKPKEQTELEANLRKVLDKFGLKDVSLEVAEAIAGGRAGGSYLNSLIKIALDEANPVRTLRHESLHALRDLGFFTDQQWKALTNQAKSKWVDTYLKQKNIDGQPLKAGETSRYDAYVSAYKGDMDAIYEEAIADAFGDFDATKAPPGMLAALLKKLNDFFAALKNALTGAGFQTAEDIFGKVEKAELKPTKAAEAEEKLSLRRVKDLFDKAEAIPQPKGVEIIRDNWVGGVSGVGERDSAYDLYRVQGGKKYMKDVQDLVRKELGDNFKGYRLMHVDELEEIQTGAMGSQLASFTLRPDIAEAFASLATYKKVPKDQLRIVEMNLTPEHIWMIGHPAERELVVDYGQGYAPDEVISTPLEAEKLSLRIMRGEVTPKFDGKVTVDKVGKYFDDQVLAEFGRKLDYNNPEDFSCAAKEAGGEVAYQLAREKSGLDWYEEDIQKAFKDTIKIIPELKKEENRILFSVMAGIMSPQTNARDNWFIAAKAFQHYLKTGTIPGVNPDTGGLWQGGTTSANKKVQLEFLDRLVTQVGKRKAIEWIMNDHTVKEINDYRSKYGNLKSGIDGKLGDIKPGLYAFGPKVGPFVSNINGIHDVTVDMWMTRTFNRYFGTMIGPDGKIVDAPTEPQRKAIKELVNKVAQDANIKPYQVQSVLWFYEQSLFSKLGTPAPSYGFSDGAAKFVDDARGGGGEKGVAVAPKKAERLSLRDVAWSNKRIDRLLGTYAYTTSGREGDAKAYAARITPKDFLNATNTKESLQRIAEETTELSPEKLAKEDQEIYLEIRKEGDSDYQIVNHEGRHRMMALLNAGYDRGVPVVLINRPYGAVKDAQPVEEVYLRRQQFGDQAALKGINVQLMVPINWNSRDELRKQFGGEAQVKFSLRTPGQPATKENVLAAMKLAKESQPFMNCQLCVQMATGVTKLLDLPKVKTAQVGDIYTFNEQKGMASHYAIDLGDGNVVEVEAWGEPVREVPLQSVIAEYDEPSSIRRPPPTAYTEEGKLSLRSPNTPEFKRWFGDSKVVDADGKPLVMYHGAKQDIEGGIFRMEKGMLGTGAYFTSNPQEADFYTSNAVWRTDANIVPVYVSIKKPYITKDKWDKGAQKAKENGHDGVILLAPNGKDVDWAIPFSPNQIKSAISNVGTYSPEAADIRYSLRDSIDPATLNSVDRITTAREEKGFVERITEAIAPKSFSHFRQQALNRYNRLGEADRIRAERMGGKYLLADASAESAALMSDLAAGVSASALGVHDRIGGIPVFRNGVTTVWNDNGNIKGPTAIFAPLAKYNDPFIYQLYQFWAGSLRGKRLTAEGREHLYTPADMTRAQQLLKEYPEFESIQKEWIKYNNGLMEYSVATGVLSRERANEFMRYSDYIPFYRQLDGENTIGPRIFQSISGVKSPKKLKGGEQPLDDLVETIVRNTQSIIQAGMKNVAAQRGAQLAVDINLGVRLPQKTTGPDIITVLENGKEVSYAVRDPLFVEAAKSLNLPDLPFIGLLSGPANLLRNLVTKDPGFMLANMMRDSMAAWVTSGVNMTPVSSTVINFTKAIAGKSPEFEALLNAGIIGGYEFSQNVQTGAKEMEKAMRKKAGVKPTGAAAALSPATSLWEALEKGTTASDAATRMEIYKQTLAETGNEAEALFRALEVMNFNRKGSSPVVRILTAAVPFLNARIQGLDVLYRAAFGKMGSENAADIQRAFFVRGMTIAALSCMYWALTHDDEEYQKQEEETKDNNWLIPSLGVKIPIPFEIGVLFKVVPERIMAYTFGDDTGQDFLRSMGRNLASTLVINPIPQTALPVVEATTNFSFFTMRPIVGQGMEDVAPGFQVGPSTSIIAEEIGKALNISPMKLDHMIKGYTGTMGMYMIDLIDSVLDVNRDSPKPAKRFEQLPVIKRFALDPEARGNVTAYYDLKNAVDQAVRTSNYLERSQSFDDYGKYMEETVHMLATRDYVLDLEKTMKEFREMKVLIRASDMSGTDKRDALVEVNRMEDQLTKNIREIRAYARQ